MTGRTEPLIGRRGLVALRWFILGLAAVATLGAAFVAWNHGRGVHGGGSFYRCPMHPEVTSPVPGECPICRMALVPVSRDPEPRGPPAPATEAMPEDPARAGGYVVRQRVFTDNIRAPAWVESPGVLTAHLYLDELDELAPGARGEFTPAVAPANRAAAALSGEPAVPWDASTATVHLQLDAGAALEQGTTGWLRFPSKLRHATLVPSKAILQSPEGPYVFAATADQPSWRRQAVRLGKVFSGQAFVLTGLRDGESVAVDGLFFIDADWRLRQTREPGARADTAR